LPSREHSNFHPSSKAGAECINTTILNPRLKLAGRVEARKAEIMGWIIVFAQVQCVPQQAFHRITVSQPQMRVESIRMKCSATGPGCSNRELDQELQFACTSRVRAGHQSRKPR
jgi:hypothetical protein